VIERNKGEKIELESYIAERQQERFKEREREKEKLEEERRQATRSKTEGVLKQLLEELETIAHALEENNDPGEALKEADYPDLGEGMD
tara:strand:- start:593 stop:856 length:264 start_codon:yes stop_codon:yes gene_type:complete